MSLEQKLVTRYAKYNALKHLLEKWLKEARTSIVEALQAGTKCPDKGPYLLELSEAKGAISWKDEFRKYLVGAGMTLVQADQKLEEISAQDREKDVRLLCKANPNYGRKVEIRLPTV